MSTTLTRNADRDTPGGNIYTDDADGQIVGKIDYLIDDARPYAPKFRLVRMGRALNAMFQNPGAFHSLEAAEFHLLASVAEATEAAKVAARAAADKTQGVDVIA